MVGDFVLLMRELFRQHITCKHNYRSFYGRGYDGSRFDHLECKKCGKWA